MELKLKLQREIVNEHRTIGSLYVDGDYYCDTLEPPISRESHPAVPAGTYEVRMFPSQKFRALRPILIGVKGRSEILIHEGNYVRQTLGCILVGVQDGKGNLIHSMDKLSPLCRWIKDTIKRDIRVLIEIVDKQD